MFKGHFRNLAGLYLSILIYGGWGIYSIPSEDPTHESLGSRPQLKVCSADYAVWGVLNLITAAIITMITIHVCREGSRPTADSSSPRLLFFPLGK